MTFDEAKARWDEAKTHHEFPSDLDNARHSFGIKLDQITDEIRVSTCCVPSGHSVSNFWYVETWIFSEDPRVGNHQAVAATPWGDEPHVCERHIPKALKIHGYMAANLRRKFGTTVEAFSESE